MTVAPATDFDVREYARTARGSHRAELDLAVFAAEPLAPDVTRLLEVLQMLEGATMAHLRNVLVTPTHKDARVTAFLVSWAYEKFWIADALGAICDASGRVPRNSGDERASLARRVAVRGPVRRALAGFAQGPAVVGAHMAVGLVDDWVLDAAYRRAVDTSGSDALAEALAGILAVKARHTRFFDEETRRRLAVSPRAARLARGEWRRSGMPVGTELLGADDRRFFARFVWSGADGAARAGVIERRIRDLPGIGAVPAARMRADLAG